MRSQSNYGRIKKDGWEEAEELSSEDEQLFSFTSILVHEEFNGTLTVSYNIDETELICVCVELDHSEGFDTVKKGFSGDDNMEPEEIIKAAIETVRLGINLLLLKK